LIELGKDFEVMYYPSEPHTVQTEASRLDQSRRAIRFFDRYLKGRGN
jgi:dipeptidyl aminopeptidase/acylaminoacyl peptidase